ncbi:MAG: acyl-CoA thioesterase [Actinomycetes bacterium]
MTTDAASFLGLSRVDEAGWSLPVTAGIATPFRFLFGGCGLGAAIAALEGTTGRPVVWSTSQYLSYAMVGSTVEISVTVAQAGRQVTQARATGRVGDREIFTVNAALGTRGRDYDGRWTTPPDVLAPDLCPLRQVMEDHEDTIMGRLELRLAAGRVFDQLSDGSEGRPVRRGSGRSALWVSMSGLEASGAGLAIIGDYVPFGIGQALGLRAGGNSLDNTLRVIEAVPSDWVLLDIDVHAVANGFGHGLVHLWSEDGTLLGTASQSVIVRRHDPERARIWS